MAPDQAPTDAPTGAMMDDEGKAIVYQTKYPKSAWLQVDANEPMEQSLEKELAYLENIGVMDK